RAAAEKLVEDAATTAEDIAEDIERIVESTASAATTCTAHPRIERIMAVLIVGGAFLRVAQRFISFPKFFEFFLGRFIAGILIGVIFNCEFAVRFFNFLSVCVSLDAEDFVVIAFGHLIKKSKPRNNFRNLNVRRLGAY